jgi:hypothetical protein
MRKPSVRSLFLSSAAIAGAVLWGVAEFIALQMSRNRERFRAF